MHYSIVLVSVQGPMNIAADDVVYCTILYVPGGNS
jgi:hypothetical protein